MTDEDSLTKQIKDKQKRTRRTELSTRDTGTGLMGPELRADAPQEGKNSMRCCWRDKTVKGFHPEPTCAEGSHTGTPKRVTAPAGITADGAKALSFRPEKPLNHAWYFELPIVPE
jgi:hypothetical protein